MEFLKKMNRTMMKIYKNIHSFILKRMDDEHFDTYTDPCYICELCDELNQEYFDQISSTGIIHSDNLIGLMYIFNKIQDCIAKCERCIHKGKGNTKINQIADNLRMTQEIIGDQKVRGNKDWFD